MFFDMSDKQSLTTKVYNHIRDGILDGTYPIGGYLVETRLADEMDVSRTPVREALKQLELEGLVDSIPNRGMRVQGITDGDLDDIHTIRLLLEGQAVGGPADRSGASGPAGGNTGIIGAIHQAQRCEPAGQAG